MRMFLFSSLSPRQRLAMAPEASSTVIENTPEAKSSALMSEMEAKQIAKTAVTDVAFDKQTGSFKKQDGAKGRIDNINTMFDASKVLSMTFVNSAGERREFKSDGTNLHSVDANVQNSLWVGYRIESVQYGTRNQEAETAALNRAALERSNRAPEAIPTAQERPSASPAVAPAVVVEQLDQQLETTTGSTQNSISALHDNVEGSALDEAGRTNIRELAKALGVHTEHAEGVAGDKNAAILIDAITMLRESGVSEADICTRMQVALDFATLSDHFREGVATGTLSSLNIKPKNFIELAGTIEGADLAPLLTRFFSNVSPLQLLSGNSTFFDTHQRAGGHLLDKPQTLAEVRDQATDKPNTKGAMQVLLESAGMRSDFAKALTLPERLVNWSTLDVRSDILDPRKGAFGTELKHEQVAAFVNQLTDEQSNKLKTGDGANADTLKGWLTDYLNSKSPDYLTGTTKERITAGKTSFERTTNPELAQKRQEEVAAIANRLFDSMLVTRNDAKALDAKTAMLLSVGLNMQKAVLDDIKTIDGAVSPVLLAPGIKLERAVEGNESRRANGLWLDSGKADSPAARFLAERGMNMNAKLDAQDTEDGVQKKISIDMPKLFRNRQRETNDTTATKVKEELVIYLPKGAIEQYRGDLQKQISDNPEDCTLQLKFTGDCTTEVRHTRSKGAETTEMFISSDVAKGGQYEGIRITLDNGQLKMSRSTVDRTLPAMDADIKDRYIAQHGGPESGKGVGDVASVYTAEAIGERQETFIPAGVDTFNVLGGSKPGPNIVDGGIR